MPPAHESVFNQTKPLGGIEMYSIELVKLFLEGNLIGLRIHERIPCVSNPKDYYKGKLVEECVTGNLYCIEDVSIEEIL